jgi:hypothetical protein
MDMQQADPERRMRSGPFAAHVLLGAELAAQEWGIVVAALRKLPFEVVADIIGKLSDQLTAAQQAADAPPSPAQE